MLVTLSGIDMLVSPVHPENALSLILVTLLGIVMLVRLEQSANAATLILVTLLGTVASPVLPPGQQTSVRPSIESTKPSIFLYAGLPETIFIDVSLSQAANAHTPILVTLLGIVTPVNFEHLRNAIRPMLLTLFGIVTVVRLSQSANA